MRRAVARLDIRQLDSSDAAELRQIWMEVKGSPSPKTFSARLMRLALAWDAQAMSEGEEPVRINQAWNRIIRDRSGQPAGNSLRGGAASAVADGTRILKDWGGTTHEVLVTEDGATWNGESYTSLSAVARAMTGTNRNGPKFFGLREGAKS